MLTTKSSAVCMSSLRPLVRYVDDERAVLDLNVTLQCHDTFLAELTNTALYVQMSGPEGMAFEDYHPLLLHEGAGMVRFEVIGLQRWWPAGMGAQALYDMTVSLAANEEILDTWRTTIGLTSVRPMQFENFDPAEKRLLVNGQLCQIHSVVPVHPTHERHVLAVAGDSLLVIRDHFGPERLFNAADRAGVLLLQAVPTQATAESDAAEPVVVQPGKTVASAPKRTVAAAAALAMRPQEPPADASAPAPVDAQGPVSSERCPKELLAQINRLVTHPSLAGWLVDELGALTDQVASLIHTLDPTRAIFRQTPGQVIYRP